MVMEEKIKDAITRAININHLEVINESNLHAGHAGDDGSGQTHFKLVVVSNAFLECNRIQRQRMINTIIGPLFEEGLHAVSMELSTLGEFNI